MSKFWRSVGLGIRQNESVPNKVRYFRIPGIGPGKVAHEGTWADVLEAVPYFLMPGGPIPPRQLVNEVLKVGVVDAGTSGGCEWDATELDEESYNGVVHELLARPPQHVAYGGGHLEEVGCYKRLPAPPWVRTQSEFTFWSVEIARGVPALVHRDLCRRIDELVQAASDAYKHGDQLQQDRLEAALVEAEEEVAELWRRTDRWRQKRRRWPRPHRKTIIPWTPEVELIPELPANLRGCRPHAPPKSAIRGARQMPARAT